MPFTPIYPDGRIIPIHPYIDMPDDVAVLWKYFSETLGWGTKITSRVTFDSLIHARTFALGKVLLDAGAGHQRYRPFFSESTYLSQEHPSGIAMKHMEAVAYSFVGPLDEAIPLKDSSVNCVLNTVVLEHIRFPERFLKETHRVLAPQGRIYMHVPFSYCEHEQPYDFHRVTRYGLRAWLEAAGFPDICIYPSSNSTYGSSWHFAESLGKELTARGSTLTAVLVPLAKHIVEQANLATDDFIDPAATMPVGWIAIAQK